MTITYDENRREIVAVHRAKVKYLGLAEAQTLAESVGMPSVVKRALRDPGAEIVINTSTYHPRNARPFRILL